MIAILLIVCRESQVITTKYQKFFPEQPKVEIPRVFFAIMIPNTIFVKRVALALSLAASASSAPVEEAIMPAALNVRDPQNVTKAAGRDLPGNGADCTMYLDGELSGYGFTGFQLQ